MWKSLTCFDTFILHSTLYLSKFEKNWTLFKSVFILKFHIPIMKYMYILFHWHLEKHELLLRSILGVATLTKDIANYPCLSEASTSDYYSTTYLQYSVVKIFKNLYKLTVRRLQIHEIYTAYEGVSVQEELWTELSFYFFLYIVGVGINPGTILCTKCVRPGWQRYMLGRDGDCLIKDTRMNWHFMFYSILKCNVTQIEKIVFI